MNRELLLSYGYLFKELPPVFNSATLGQKIESINLPSCANTKCVEFTIPKGRYSRRRLQLPHPINFIHLVLHLTKTDHWKILKDHFDKSQYSNSKVKLNNNAGKKISSKDNRATKTSYDTFSASRKKALIETYNKLFELKVDISKFYPSIYSHSIVWALIGKEKARYYLSLPEKERSDKPEYPIFNFADKLDKLIRSCQEKQSVGIPIGPDTSHIISEIIGTYFDSLLELNFKGLKAYRYFDDYFIYPKDELEGQLILTFLQKNLSEFQLTLNETKTKLRKYPFEFEEDWIKSLHSVDFLILSETKLKQYFSVLFGLAGREIEKSDTIFSYALKTFEKGTTRISPEHWNLFESLILRSTLIEPSILEIVSRIFESYREYCNKEKLRSTLIRILDIHCDLNHHFETVWALWIFKQFDLILPKNLVDRIIKSNDCFSLLVLLDLNNKGLVEESISEKSKIEIGKILDSRENESDWLLHYESVEIKKWIPATSRDELKVLSKNGISFYDETAKIKTWFATSKSIQGKPTSSTQNVDDIADIVF